MDTTTVMNGLDIIVLTSLNEGTPLSLLEAQYFKRPVVATDVGGVRDSFKDGISGFLVKPGDITVFAQKVLLLADDKHLRGQMGEEGYRFVTTAFDKTHEVQATKQLFKALLQGKGYAVDNG